MKITHVSHQYLPKYGGIEYYAYRLVGSLAKSGHESRVVTTDASLRGAPSGVNLDFGDVAYCKTDISLLRNPFSVELFKNLRASEANVYHLHSPWTLPSLEAVFALPADAPVVVTVHGFQPFTSLFARLVSRAYRPFAQRIFSRADAIIVLGGSEANRLHREFDVDSEKVVVIPNGIDLEEANVDDHTVEAFREKHGLDPAIPTVLFVGRLVPEKNPELLVEALSGPLADLDYQALVIGTGKESYVDHIQDIADDRIRFASGLPREELLAAYQVSDLFVLLSVSEGLPTVVLEAMHAGLPVVTTPVGALPDYITPDHGTTVRVDATPEELADALRPYLEDADYRTTVGARNRDLVERRFDWDLIAGTIESLYATLDEGAEFDKSEIEEPVKHSQSQNGPVSSSSL